MRLGLFRKKCEYCKSKIEKGREVYRDVKVPGYLGTKKKAILSDEHADSYEKEVEDRLAKTS